jgi:hypothetical protein
MRGGESEVQAFGAVVGRLIPDVEFIAENGDGPSSGANALLGWIVRPNADA